MYKRLNVMSSRLSKSYMSLMDKILTLKWVILRGVVMLTFFFFYHCLDVKLWIKVLMMIMIQNID